MPNSKGIEIEKLETEREKEKVGRILIETLEKLERITEIEK